LGWCSDEQKGYDSFESVLNNGMQAIAVKTLNLSLEETGALILDTRKWCFYQRIYPAIHQYWYRGDFAPGWVL
jgi:hypothetical protein